MTSKTKHTPTPWQKATATDIVHNSLHIVKTLQHGHVSLKDAEANAAFIVRAVNAHEKIIRCATRILKFESKDESFMAAIGGMDQTAFKNALLKDLEDAISCR